MKKIFSLLLIVFVAVQGFAQGSIDSIKHCLQTNNAKVLAARYIDLAGAYKYINLDSMNFYAELGCKQAKKVGEDDLALKGEYYKIIYLQRSGKHEEAIELCDKYLAIVKDRADAFALYENFLAAKGSALMIQKKNKDALACFIKCIEIGEQHKDYMVQLRGHINAGWALMELNQQANAIVYFKKGLAIIDQQKIADEYPLIYNNIASCYGYLNYIDSVQKYAEKGISLAQKVGDINAESNGLFILSGAYDSKKMYRQSLNYMQAAKKLRELVQDPSYSVADNVMISEEYVKLKMIDSAMIYATSSLDTANKYHIDSKLPSVYLTFIDIYDLKGDYKSMTEYYQKYIEIQNSLYDKANVEAIAELQAKYEKEKQDRKIKERDFKILQQNFIIAGIVFVMLLFGLIVFLMYKRYQQKQEAKLWQTIQQEQAMAAIAILDAEMKERHRIASDLHDGVGQMMSAVKLNLSAFSAQHPAKLSQADPQFDNIMNLVDACCKEVRHVSHSMMPAALLKNKLANAVQEFVSHIDQSKLKINLYISGFDKALHPNVETILYRVIQESVNNVIKHAQATTIEISLVNDTDGIDLMIEDNGIGFDTTKVMEGIGLKNIEARILFLKGTVDFSSMPGKGSVVSVHIPANAIAL